MLTPLCTSPIPSSITNRTTPQKWRPCYAHPLCPLLSRPSVLLRHNDDAFVNNYCALRTADKRSGRIQFSPPIERPRSIYWYEIQWIGVGSVWLSLTSRFPRREGASWTFLIHKGISEEIPLWRIYREIIFLRENIVSSIEKIMFLSYCCVCHKKQYKKHTKTIRQTHFFNYFDIQTWK